MKKKNIKYGSLKVSVPMFTPGNALLGPDSSFTLKEGKECHLVASHPTARLKMPVKYFITY